MIILASIDTTPNPNSMKLNLSAALGVSGTFTRENKSFAPDVVKLLLDIQGVVSVFSAASFLTLNRDPRADWQLILGAVEQVFAGNKKQESSVEAQREVAQHHGQVKVLVQIFREIPIQVKVTDGVKEERVALPPRFGNTAREFQMYFGADYLKERHWADWGVRYGTLAEVAREVADEVESVWDEASLNKKKVLALGELRDEPGTVEASNESKDASAVKLDSPDWNARFQALQQLEASEDALPHLVRMLQDEKPQIRRWAAAKLAGIKSAESVGALCQAMLTDSNVGVRRTAGDSLSDIDDISALESMCQALSDHNKLVRWRAARFLAEAGTGAALPYLDRAKEDPEYEVRLEVEAAINHIIEGSKAALPVWKLMSQDH